LTQGLTAEHDGSGPEGERGANALRGPVEAGGERLRSETMGEFTPEQETIRQTVNRICREKLAPRAAEMDRTSEVTAP